MCQPDVGANLMFALELITLSFLCTMGEHKVKKGTSMILCFYWQEVESFKEKHKIIDVPFFTFPNRQVRQVSLSNLSDICHCSLCIYSTICCNIFTASASPILPSPLISHEGTAMTSKSLNN